MDVLFDHERLEVYRLARHLNREMRAVLASVPRGHAESRDNLSRATKSITRNIAEGAGKWRIRDKVHFYHIARASATECAASLDELVDCALIAEDEIVPLKHTLSRLVAMLIAMIKSLESRQKVDMGR